MKKNPLLCQFVLLKVDTKKDRKSEKQAVKGSNCCLKKENEITDNDGVISGGNEKITYQRIEFSQRKIVPVYTSFDTQYSRSKCTADI
jgi:hypothetical protein